MANSVAEFLENLQNGAYNMKELERTLGVPYDRIVGWRRGEGRPKAEDQRKIEEYLNLPQYRPQSPAERIAALESDKRVLQDALLANLEILKGQNATIIQMIRETREEIEDQADARSGGADGDRQAKDGRKYGGSGKPR